jgi:MFS family permease
MFYAYGVLMLPMQTELQLTRPLTVGAFSIALLISGLLSPLVGSFIDRHGGRIPMALGSVLSAILLVALSRVQDAVELYVVWGALGVAMSCTLYQPAFAVLTKVFHSDYRRAIALVTLFGGFSSTLSWPLTQWLLDHHGWRESWQLYALANIALCMPLHALLPKAAPTIHEAEFTKRSYNLTSVFRAPGFFHLAIAFTLNALVFSALSLHLMSILKDSGMPSVYAATIGAMVGPMQVLGRLLESVFGRDASSRTIGVVAISLVPAALLFLFAPANCLLFYGLFAVMYGIGSGIITIVRGTLPAELYGREAYGAISGAMAMPVMLAFAAGPYVASLLYDLGEGYPITILGLFVIATLAAVLFHYATACMPVASASRPR